MWQSIPVHILAGMCWNGVLDGLGCSPGCQFYVAQLQLVELHTASSIHVMYICSVSETHTLDPCSSQIEKQLALTPATPTTTAWAELVAEALRAYSVAVPVFEAHGAGQVGWGWG